MHLAFRLSAFKQKNHRLRAESLRAALIIHKHMAVLSRNVTKRLALGHSLPPSSPNCCVNRPLTVQRFRDMKLEIAERLQKWIIMQFLGSLSYHLERVNFPCLLHGLEHCKFPASSQHDTHTSHTRTAAYKGFAFFFFPTARAALWQVVQQQTSPAAVQGPCAWQREQGNEQRMQAARI